MALHCPRIRDTEVDEVEDGSVLLIVGLRKASSGVGALEAMG